ncbi:MAG: UDP-N-acetylglucosamine 2-epimerase (non-hydrolyzing) [Bdellovibrionota bacterium]
MTPSQTKTANKNHLVAVVVGARPNFMKIARLRKVVKQSGNFDLHIVHTGQHFDEKMAKVFLEQFEIRPDAVLEARGSSAALQIGNMILGLSKHFEEIQPDLVVAVGDVTSALGAAISANKMGIHLAHLEAGLRSFDRSMPEENNRIIVDELANFCFVTESSGEANLRKMGKDPDSVFFVGNTMIDTLIDMDKLIDQSSAVADLNLPSEYAVVTAHRPALVDTQSGLSLLSDVLTMLSRYYRICFPVHPRTKKNLQHFGLLESLEKENILLTEPLDYLAFQRVVKTAKFVLTDSGGLQEEAAHRRQPCLTIRENTERPITVELGTNTLVGFDLHQIEKEVKRIQSGNYKVGQDLPLWDGRATERIVGIINKLIEKKLL